MARLDGAALLPLAESIADGSPIDWDAAEASANVEEQAIIRQLRILENLAGLHRSLPADPADQTKSDPATMGRRASASPAIGSWAHLALVERLGGGSFGEVYRAWDRHLEREVALKLLRGTDASIDDPQASRITMEGRLLARVRHENVITVHGVAVHEQRVGLWMELVRGATLEQQLQKHGPFSAREAALVGIDLCRALAAIHAAGLIHRDVKAQNVMREEGGRIVLMDLGTGREIDRTGRRSLSDLAGTPLYLAPEILGGATASERSDLYSLGVLLYHLVTGSFPVRATTIDQLREAHAQETGVRLRDARADLPTAFVQVVDRAIAKDPDRRYASAGAFESDLVSALDDTREAQAPAPPAADDTARTRAFAWQRTLVAAAVLAAVLVLAAIAWPVLRGRTGSTAAPGTGPIRSIAVLPLVNLSGDASQEYFADGITDELIGTLGQLGGVNVISRTSVMQFKGSKNLPEIAKALHVEAVLEGSFKLLPGNPAAGGGGAKRVRVHATLYAGTDTQLWDKTFEKVVTDVMALQSEVAKAVADGIKLHLTSQQQQVLEKAAVQNGSAEQFDAFDLYLRGRYHWNLRNEQGLKQSVQYFQEARDRGYAPAYAGLADAYHLLGVYNYMPHAEARSLASAAATKALELDPSLGEAYASLGYIHDEQLEWAAAETNFKRALEIKPGYATAHHWYAIHLVRQGRLVEARREIDRALTLDPLSLSVNGQLGFILHASGDDDDAIRQLQKTLQMDQTFARAHLILAETYAGKGDYDRALAEARTSVERGGANAEAIADVGYVHALAGRRRQALEVAGDLTARYGKREDGAAGGVAVVYAGLGDRDQAFEWLERAREVLDPAIPDLKVDRRFDKLRSDPRFGKFLATIGLAQ